VRVLAVCTAVGLALGALYVALLALTLTTTSDERIIAGLRQAVETGALEEKSYPRSHYGHRTHRYDMFTECIALGMNLRNPEPSVLRRIAASTTAAPEHGAGPCETLTASVRTGATVASQDYMRFWHGYQVYMRPLLQALPLAELVKVTAILFLMTMIVFAWRLSLLFGPWAWPLGLIPFFAISDFLTVPMVVTHALSLICAFLPAAFVPIVLQRWPNARALVLPVLVFTAGSIYNFFSFLLNPPLAPALIAFFYVAANLSHDEKDLRQTALYAAGLAAVWFCGFASAWVLKWAYAALVLGPDVVLAELHSAVERYEGARERLQVHLLSATRRNAYADPALLAFILGGCAVAAASLLLLVRKFGDWRIHCSQLAALMTPLTWIVLWVEANRAHSALHVGFVSRSFLLFGIVPLLASIKLWRQASMLPGASAAGA